MQAQLLTLLFFQIVVKLNAFRRALFVSLSSTPLLVRGRLPLAPVLMNLSLSSQAQAQTQLPQREQTLLEITLAAADDVNVDEKLRGTPILVRMYEMRSGTRFETVDYFSLHTNERAVLGQELLARDEFVLRPGETKQVRRKSHPDLELLGWTAGYRDLGQADWRAVAHVDLAPESAWYRAPLPANKVKLVVLLQRHSIRVTHAD